MKLVNALDIAHGCNLETVGEAIYNIRLHATNLFAYDEAQKEYDELISECNQMSEKYGFNDDSDIFDALISMAKNI